MIDIQKKPRPQDVRQSARHLLYVEGGGDEAFDPGVLTKLLQGDDGQTTIRVQAIGSSLDVRSAASALCKDQKDIYFLVDRDYHDDQAVEDSWRNFPDPKQSNLLIWRKREIENYFLDPDYLGKSKFFKKEKREKLKKTILRKAEERLFFDAVNHVIERVREGQKENWIQFFTEPSAFKSRQDVERNLRDKHDVFAKRTKEVADSMDMKNLMRLFDETLESFTSGSIPLRFGVGRWQDCLRGKEILHGVVASDACFQVKDRDGKALTIKTKLKYVAESLLNLPLADQPADFQELHRLITARVSEP